MELDKFSILPPSFPPFSLGNLGLGGGGNGGGIDCVSDRGDKGRPHFSSSVPSGWLEEKGGEEDERGLKGKEEKG